MGFDFLAHDLRRFLHAQAVGKRTVQEDSRGVLRVEEPGALLPLKGALLAYALVPPPAALYKPAADLQLRESPIPEERRWRTGRWHVHGSI
jgi:hypothetical protein